MMRTAEETVAMGNGGVVLPKRRLQSNSPQAGWRCGHYMDQQREAEASETPYVHKHKRYPSYLQGKKRQCNNRRQQVCRLASTERVAEFTNTI